MSARITATGWGWRHVTRLRPAITDLTLTVEPGERVLLLGPSGAGKSTLLAALAGVLGDAEDGDETGELRVDGQHPAAARGTAGLVLQDPQANTILSRVGDDVAFGCENLRVPREEIWPRVTSALDAVGLDVPLNHSTARLSGGQQQRLALAGVLAMRPNLLLLDEPTANLDPIGVTEVREAVRAVLDDTGATLVVVEHRVDTWLPLIDRVVVLDPDGGVLADGAAESVFATHGDYLVERGVWVPGYPIDIPRTPRPGETLLSAESLVVGRGGEAVFGPVDVTLRAGESTVMLGPNGAGKSTLALTMASLLKPVAGQVVAAETLCEGHGSRLGTDPHVWKSRELSGRIGTVFQEPEHQFVATTVHDELAVSLRASGVPRATYDSRIDELLTALRLDRLAKAHPFSLSGGEQRRLSVATVLAARPRVIILDEPTFGQDRTTWRELVTLMASLVDDGCALLTATHDADVARILGDRILEVGR